MQKRFLMKLRFPPSVYYFISAEEHGSFLFHHCAGLGSHIRGQLAEFWAQKQRQA